MSGTVARRCTDGTEPDVNAGSHARGGRQPDGAGRQIDDAARAHRALAQRGPAVDRRSRNLPAGAGASCRSVSRTGAAWIGETPHGPVVLWFVVRNDCGGLDHDVGPARGQEILNPMRVMPDGWGSDAHVTLRQ